MLFLSSCCFYTYIFTVVLQTLLFLNPVVLVPTHPKYLSRLDFTQIINRATHLDGHILDHVYVPKRKVNQTKIKHHYVYYSDHDGILVKLQKDDFLE